MSKGFVSLKQAERNIFKGTFDDGLVDIFLSSVVLIFAVAPLLSEFLGDFWSSAVFLPLWVFLFIVLRWIRVHVIIPRRGVVKHGPQRKRKLTVFSWIMILVNIAFLIFGLIVGYVLPSNSWWTTLLPFSVMVLALFSLAGYFLDVRRFFVYGLMLAVSPFIGEWLFQNYNVSHHAYPIIFGMYAAIILFTGLLKLLSFLRENPLPSEEQYQWEMENG